MEIKDIDNIFHETNKSEKSSASEKEYEENRSKRLDNDIKSEDKELGKKFASKIFILTIIYLLYVAIVLLLIGFRIKSFYLSDKVLITLLGTTTATMIGVFNFVMKYLFHK